MGSEKRRRLRGGKCVCPVYLIFSPTTPGQSSTVYLSPADLGAMIILHELGHETGVFGEDENSQVNGQHTWEVLQNCFGMQPPTMIRTVVVAIIALTSLRAQAADAVQAGLHASVRNLKVSHITYPVGRDRVLVAVTFEATVKNDRDRDARLSSERPSFTGADLRLETGEWKSVMNSLLLFPAVAEHECSHVHPGGAYTLPDVGASFAVDKIAGRLPSSVVTVRFHVVSTCQEGPLELHEDIVTDPVKIDLAAIGEK